MAPCRHVVVRVGHRLMTVQVQGCWGGVAEFEVMQVKLPSKVVTFSYVLSERFRLVQR